MARSSSVTMTVLLSASHLVIFITFFIFFLLLLFLSNNYGESIIIYHLLLFLSNNHTESIIILRLLFWCGLFVTFFIRWWPIRISIIFRVLFVLLLFHCLKIFLILHLFSFLLGIQLFKLFEFRTPELLIAPCHLYKFISYLDKHFWYLLNIRKVRLSLILFHHEFFKTFFKIIGHNSISFSL